MKINLQISMAEYTAYNDAVFYADPEALCVAKVSLNDRSVDVLCVGELRATVTIDSGTEDEFQETVRYGDHMRSLFASDAELQKAEESDKIQFDNNSWFALYEEENEDVNGSTDNAFHTLPEALTAAACYLKTGQFDGDCGIHELNVANFIDGGS
jgi:hypothetical protein